MSLGTWVAWGGGGLALVVLVAVAVLRRLALSDVVWVRAEQRVTVEQSIEHVATALAGMSGFEADHTGHRFIVPSTRQRPVRDGRDGDTGLELSRLAGDRTEVAAWAHEGWPWWLPGLILLRPLLQHRLQRRLRQHLDAVGRADRT